RVPVMHDVNLPRDWTEVSALGEAVPVTEGTGRRTLSGQPGSAMRWTLRGLPTDIPPGGLDLFLRCQVRSADYGLNIEECLVQVAATSGGTPGAQPRLLALAKDSPYGYGTDG